ncbi:GAF domain-containing protein [Fortiea sp. LEGE XX443]|uniref:GAF domain-containing protein n=1 Tax=Fortiea sp. LEGE XX443 TaxID=1828611 RepID=UPI001882E518|nr:GAF domain-containing protein [Fortiea sp. LEGE XX443]MBE9005291.1 GAF domain-containing protein [Fortiea sp. LEGE XX443]
MTQISEDTVKDLVAKEGVTDSELEVLVLALNGKLPAEIKTILGRQSENAVQKTMSRIYTKFRIPGAGPGKLSKLQNILLDRLQAKQGKRKVLIAWAGSNSKHQAEQIRDVIFKHPQIETFILDIDESLNPAWLSDTEQLISNIDFGILCLPKECFEYTWVNFLIGLFYGKLQNFRVLRFIKKVNFKAPMYYPSIDGTDKNNLIDLLHEIIGGDVEEAKDWINYKLSTSNWFKKILEEELDDFYQTELSTDGIILKTLQPILKNNDFYQTNKIFQQVIINDITNIERRIEFLVSNGLVYKMPLELYPRHLAALQQKYQVRVKAVAIVDGVESFWASDEGDEVAKTANPESERLFVFSNERDFENSYHFLLRHASYYKVFVTTKDIYMPYAQEFSIRDVSNILNVKYLDSNLPTTEYAIIESSDEMYQLIVWYDQDNIRESRSIRVVNFSPLEGNISQYKKILSDFLARANRNNEKIYQITLQNSNQKIKSGKALEQIVAQKFEQIRDNLFRKSLDECLKYPNKLLKDLQKVRNSLKRLDDKDHVIEKALQLVRERLNSQTAAIFLFSKDGYLHRQKILGVDANSYEIDEKWFEDEAYKPGESFTGKAAIPSEDSFGKPYSANDLSEILLDTKSKEKYSEKLGGIYSAIAVPLDGEHKTFGVLEVINKFDPLRKQPITDSGFSQEEIHWLSTIGLSVASAISNLRKKIQVKLLGDLSDSLVGSCNNDSDIKEAYRSVVQRLISENTAFEVCILRVKNKKGFLEVVDKAGVERIIWNKRLDEPRSNEDGLVGNVMSIKKYVIIQGINNQNIKEFKNQDWIRLNEFKSFGCFPLIYKAEVVGAISLYTGYEYDFHPGCQEFLQRVASLVAAFIGRVKESEAVNHIVQELDNCPTQSMDLLQLKEEELREQLFVVQQRYDTIRQRLGETFGHPQESNNLESSEEPPQKIATKYCS